MVQRPWALAVDYGTSNTVAAVVELDSAVRLLQFSGHVSLPSAVFFDPTAEPPMLVGNAAARAGQLQPGSVEPNPKRAVGTGSTLLGGQVLPVDTLVAATLRAVFEEAWRQHDGVPPGLLVLTHPAVWEGNRLQVLQAAAEQALPPGADVPLVLLAEPVAAAWHASRSRAVPEQARIAVLDLGGGTCDVAVVDRDGERFHLAGEPAGVDPLGGEDFDVRLLTAVLADAGRPQLHEQLVSGGDAGLRMYQQLRRSVREAKETLSELPRTSVLVPLPDGETMSVQVSRAHTLEGLLLAEGPDRPGLDTAADLMRDALSRVPASPAPVFVFLVGGSSRIPLLGRVVQERTGHAPLEHGDPGTVVAEGAAQIAGTYLRTGELPPVQGRLVPGADEDESEPGPVDAADTATQDGGAARGTVTAHSFEKPTGPTRPVERTEPGRRGRRRVGWAVGLVAATALGVVGVNSLLPDRTEPGVGAADPTGQDDGETIALEGSGAESLEAAMTAWIEDYRASEPDVDVHYTSIGSAGGRANLIAGTAQFAGSDTPLDRADQQAVRAACGPEGAMSLPVAISPVAVPYNLEGVDTLQLKPATLARIFNREITTWNDPAIAADNPGATLPGTAITVVHRSDDSSTTQTFTQYLAEVAGPDWGHEPGRSWPVPGGEPAALNAGVIDIIRSTSGTIGYVDATSVGGLRSVRVGVDSYVGYSRGAAAAALDASAPAGTGVEGDLAVELNRESGAYPIVRVSYVIVCKQYADKDTADTVQDFVGYLASEEGQNAAADATGSVPISAELQDKVKESLDLVTDAS